MCFAGVLRVLVLEYSPPVYRSLQHSAIFPDLRQCDQHDVNTPVVMVMVMLVGAIPSGRSRGEVKQGTNLWEKEVEETYDT